MSPETTGETARHGGAQDGELHFLVAYATRYGSTRGVADAIAEELRDAGHDVDVRTVAETSELAQYDAVVVGGPMIRGWHKDALAFVAAHRRELAERPTAYFITAASLTETGEDEVQGVPIVKDLWLAKRPRDAAKLRRKERYAFPSHYLGDVFRKTEPFRPRAVAFFAGSLDLARMSLFDKLFVLLVVGAVPGDGRNWKAIREWARGLPTSLGG
ncbi:MAG TPA: flavodoxin domain-containing protein [Thermoleophilia bacterium]|nr:flavodoxin domain-containing protein [Thermoleophilia bacterium]